LHLASRASCLRVPAMSQVLTPLLSRSDGDDADQGLVSCTTSWDGLLAREQEKSLWAILRTQSEREMDLQILEMLAVEMNFFRQGLGKSSPPQIMCSLQNLFISFQSCEGISKSVMRAFFVDVQEVFGPLPTTADIQQLWELLGNLKMEDIYGLQVTFWADVKRWGDLRGDAAKWGDYWPDWGIEDPEERFTAQEETMVTKQNLFIADLVSRLDDIFFQDFIQQCPLLKWFVRGLKVAAKAGNYEYLTCPLIGVDATEYECIFKFLGPIQFLPLCYVLDDLSAKGIIDTKHFAANDSSFKQFQTCTTQRTCLKMAQLKGAMAANRLWLIEAKQKLLGFVVTVTVSVLAHRHTMGLALRMFQTLQNNSLNLSS